MPEEQTAKDAKAAKDCSHDESLNHNAP